MAARSEQRAASAYAVEVARLRAAQVLGESGRLRELFDFLADRGAESAPASQADIADTVFGQLEVAADDATVRVYVHRLRKRLDEFYAREGEGSGRLVVPAGAYALRFVGADADEEAPPLRLLRPQARHLWLALAAIPLIVLAFFAGQWLAPDRREVNALWQPFVDSKRPLAVVVGDYYIYGEIDPLKPERSRLIRDFSVNSPDDLMLAQQAEPERYGAGEDVGLNYLPFASAFGLADIMPVLAQQGRPVRVFAASHVDPETLRNADIVYIGLVSGLGSLDHVVFRDSGFEVGENYDELVDTDAGKSYISEEARELVTDEQYKDYGFVTRFRSAGGGLVAVIAGTRETGLRGIAPIVTGKLPPALDKVAQRGANFVSLFEVTGQQGADLSEKLVAARARK